jgi:hypothetical protein
VPFHPSSASGHAVRMAIDLGINRSFSQLLKSGMGADKTPAELEKERDLVVKSRVWFSVGPRHPPVKDLADRGSSIA